MKCLTVPCALSDVAVSHKVTATQSLFQELPVHVLRQSNSTNQTQIQSEQD